MNWTVNKTATDGQCTHVIVTERIQIDNSVLIFNQYVSVINDLILQVTLETDFYVLSDKIQPQTYKETHRYLRSCYQLYRNK